MAKWNYISCIKIAGYPLLPPLVKDSDRAELLKVKEVAINLENTLTLKRLSNCDKLSLTSVPTTDQSVDDCSEGTVKLIEYIKQTLQHEKPELQDKMIAELKKCDVLKAGPAMEALDNSLSGDTLDLLDASTISSDTEKVFTPGCSDGDSSSPEKGIAIEPMLRSTPIRRRSFTLDSPSPAFIKFLQSQSNTSVTSSSSCNSKNLNDVWGNESDRAELPDYTSLPSHSVSVSAQLDHSSKDIQPNSEVNPPTNSQKSSPESSANGSVKLSLMQYSNKEEESAKRIQAAVRGFLTRRLLKTKRVLDLKKTIRDSLVCAMKLHSEQTVTAADVKLHVRLIRQVTAACYELHSIFFDLPVKEQMALIRQDRTLSLRVLARKRLSIGELKTDLKSSPSSEASSAKLGEDSVMYASYPSAVLPSLSYQSSNSPRSPASNISHSFHYPLSVNYSTPRRDPPPQATWSS